MVADLMDVFGPLGLLLLLIVLTAFVSAAWYYYPAWVISLSLGRRSRRARPAGERVKRSWRWRWRRRRKTVARVDPAVLVDLEGLGLPELPADRFRELADLLAAQGRFAEAVRERLRSIVRSLVDAAVITNHPEWTVTELAVAASHARPALRPDLAGAGQVFSDIWYGQRPATASDDDLMRRYAHDVDAQLMVPIPVTAGGSA
jgi:hypothetical protein